MIAHKHRKKKILRKKNVHIGILKKIPKFKKSIAMGIILLGVLIFSLPYYYPLFLNLFTEKPDKQSESNYSSLATLYSLYNSPIRVPEKNFISIFKDLETPIRIIIPSVSIDIPVKTAKITNGYWEIFNNEASYGSGTAPPGSIGNTVIFAHTRDGLFANLKKLKIQNKIYVFTKSKWFTYEVKNIHEVLPNDISVIQNYNDETLTLFTCTGFLDSKRLIVTSKRIY